MKLQDHPTVTQIRRRPPEVAPRLDAAALRQACLAAGADDVGFVSVDRPELEVDRNDIRLAMPTARTLVAFVKRMNPDSIRAPFRSIANLEFHHAGDETNEVARRIVDVLRQQGGRALNPAMGFPMEMDRFPAKIWVISHKRVAEAAGLGKMGIHRNIIHPRFGNFILLGTVVTDLELPVESQPIDYNPCLECKLCVAACPVGAIKADGAFDFSACYTHNYREFMGGFTDWVDKIADARSRHQYRASVDDTESASMWQSLSFGANYKAAYCMAVCPAGEDLISPFLENRRDFVQDVVRPLQQQEERVYVVPGSDAQAHVERRFPHKTVRRVGNGLRPRSIEGFAAGLPLIFQPAQSEGIAARYHFLFRGDETAELTIDIRDQQLTVQRGLVGNADVIIAADSATWLGFLGGSKSLIWAVLSRRIRIRGRIPLIRDFARCFPS
ncbi:MAG: 4Fe-4S ferredoxin [Myxococcales bacterium FL481]|nr:MAG: 4Fe-4S ferredoxin [Myxococcales bacterium FL481]